MPDAEVHQIDTKTHQYVLKTGSTRYSYEQVLRGLEEDESFRGFFIDLLIQSPFSAYRFETPSVNVNNLDRPFEFVLIDSPWLIGNADSTPFETYLSSTDDDVVEFKNIGRDATLIVPTKKAPENIYTHLASFIRSAPAVQKHALWKQVSVSLTNLLSDKPIWLNTAGGGVDWLHVRLDSFPKYYAYKSYAQS